MALFDAALPAVATHVAGHLGSLHAAEGYALAIFALGPFVVLAIVITIVSRRDRAAERHERHERASGDT
ncbi:MAG: hypothetical protein GEU96_19750 [Propionibacteriales bacterium]|nr:hypothetical protein [Propionibacteriales bacterium]